MAGKKYILIRQEFQRKSKKKKPKKSRILISLGISATRILITKIKKEIKRIGLPVRIAKKYNAIQMVDAIDTATAVICGASVTLHEVWARGRLAIPIYQAKDQIRFQKWCKNRCIPVLTSMKKNDHHTARMISKTVKKILLKKPKIIPKISPYGADKVVENLFCQMSN